MRLGAGSVILLAWSVACSAAPTISTKENCLVVVTGPNGVAVSKQSDSLAPTWRRVDNDVRSEKDIFVVTRGEGRWDNSSQIAAVSSLHTTSGNLLLQIRGGVGSMSGLAVVFEIENEFDRPRIARIGLRIWGGCFPQDSWIGRVRGTVSVQESNVGDRVMIDADLSGLETAQGKVIQYADPFVLHGRWTLEWPVQGRTKRPQESMPPSVIEDFERSGS